MPCDRVDVVRAGLIIVRVVVHSKHGEREESGKLEKTLLCRSSSAEPVELRYLL